MQFDIFCEIDIWDRHVHSTTHLELFSSSENNMRFPNFRTLRKN